MLNKINNKKIKKNNQSRFLSTGAKNIILGFKKNAKNIVKIKTKSGTEIKPKIKSEKIKEKLKKKKKQIKKIEVKPLLERLGADWRKTYNRAKILVEKVNNKWITNYITNLNKVKEFIPAKKDNKNKTRLQMMLRKLIRKGSVVNNMPKVYNVGRVVSTHDGIANIYGLNRLKLGELVKIKTINDKVITGLTLSIKKDKAQIALFGCNKWIKQGSIVTQTNELARIPCGPKVLGRIMDPIGNPLDGRGIIRSKKKMKADRKAKGIIYRQSIREPFLTGIISIDVMIPVGRGQRELIIGDRQTGKTTIGVDSILVQNQNPNARLMFCCYVAIGQKKSTVVEIAKILEKKKALTYTTIVAATADDAAALQYLAPYAGTTVAEFYRDKGQDSFVILDDLTQHAIAYRQMALLVRRPPGRDAYPGDVFYLHSRLLERGSKLSKSIGGGSLTTFPIIQTQENDVSAYIATNVISITDGQIFADRRMAKKGIFPAINIEWSVSRIGSSAQLKCIKELTNPLKKQWSDYLEVEGFISFATEIDESIWRLLIRGFRIIEVLKQDRFKPYNIQEQLILLTVLLNGYFDKIDVTDMEIAKEVIQLLMVKFDTNLFSKYNHKDYLIFFKLAVFEANKLFYIKK